MRKVGHDVAGTIIEVTDKKGRHMISEGIACAYNPQHVAPPPAPASEPTEPEPAPEPWTPSTFDLGDE
jgi:hypothetical protein